MKKVWLFEFDLESSFDYAKAKECTVIDEEEGVLTVEHRSISMYPCFLDHVAEEYIDSEDQFYPKRSFYQVYFTTYEKGLVECNKIIDERIAKYQKKIANFELMKNQIKGYKND